MESWKIVGTLLRTVYPNHFWGWVVFAACMLVGYTILGPMLFDDGGDVSEDRRATSGYRNLGVFLAFLLFAGVHAFVYWVPQLRAAEPDVRGVGGIAFGVFMLLCAVAVYATTPHYGDGRSVFKAGYPFVSACPSGYLLTVQPARGKKPLTIDLTPLVENNQAYALLKNNPDGLKTVSVCPEGVQWFDGALVMTEKQLRNLVRIREINRWVDPYHF